MSHFIKNMALSQCNMKLNSLIVFFKTNTLITVFVLFSTTVFAQKVVRYDLYVKDTLVLCWQRKKSDCS